MTQLAMALDQHNAPEDVDLADARWTWCVLCNGDRAFERPPCADSHDEGCPEWVCTHCGAAYL